MVEKPLTVLKRTRQPAAWAVLRRTQICQQILARAVTTEIYAARWVLPCLWCWGRMRAFGFSSFCRWVGLKPGIKTWVAYQIAAVKVAASLEPGSHFHFLSLSSFSSSLCLVFQNVIGRVHPDRAGLWNTSCWKHVDAQCGRKCEH